jgi:hypothetical protein
MTQPHLDTTTLRCERGEISYSYENSSDIDEFYHLYYCPFCGAFIKGHGSGNYDEKYPPAEGTRILKRKTEAK